METIQINPALAARIAHLPTLSALYQRGVIGCDQWGWYGVGTDGVLVDFGSDDEGTERYLSANPDPGQW